MTRIFVVALILSLCLFITASATAEVDYVSDYEVALTIALNDLTSIEGLQTAIDMLQKLGSFQLSKSYTQYLQIILDVLSGENNFRTTRLVIQGIMRNTRFVEDMAERGFPSCEELLMYIDARELETAGEYGSAFDAYIAMAILDAPDRASNMLALIDSGDYYISVTHKTEDGSELLHETVTIPLGSNVTIQARENFDGYVLTPDSAESVTVTVDELGRQSQSQVSFIYRRLPDTVPITVVYQTKDGKELGHETVEVARGSSLTIQAKPFSGYLLAHDTAENVKVFVDNECNLSQSEAVFIYEPESLESMLRDFDWYTIDPETGAIAIRKYNGTAENIIIPDGVTTIEAEAFRNCSSFGDILIPESVTSIGEYAFSGCSGLKSVTIPDSVINIGDFAFYGCANLTSATISDSVLNIGRGPFGGCESLTEIVVSERNGNYSAIDGVLFDKSVTKLIQYPAGSPNQSYVVPDGVTSIEIYAFCYSRSLKNITIPNSMIKIGSCAFQACSSLADVMIPDRVTSIEEGAFSACSNLQQIIVSESNNTYCSIGGILFSKTKTDLLQYPAGKPNQSYEIPKSVSTIAHRAFYGCIHLTSVTVPDSVTSIGWRAFHGCRNLTNITIPASVTSIAHYAFCYCSNLASITIPSSVTSIGPEAFSYCSKLTISVEKGSYAETYCEKNNLSYIIN